MSALGFGNATNYVVTQLEQAPNDIMVREVIMNAIEASIHAEHPTIKIMEVNPADFAFESYVEEDQLPFSEKKLCIFNNGKGMDAETLRKVCDLGFSFEKNQSLVGNFGIGFKISCMGINKKGLIFISCKDKKVNAVFLHKSIDLHTGQPQYQRFDFFDTNAVKSGFRDVLDITDLETLPFSKDEDWTAVILCGNKENQPTAQRPYSPDHEEAQAWLVNQIYSRFFRIDSRIELTTTVARSHTKNPISTFVSVEDFIIMQSKKYPDKIQYEWVNCSNGIKIMYVWDGNIDKDYVASRYNNPFSRMTSFSGIVWKNEIYDLSLSNNGVWKSVADVYGITFSSKNFRIFIELPDNFNGIPDAHRKKIMLSDHCKTPVTMKDYAIDIRNNMPDWFYEKVKSYKPMNNTNEDLQEKAQEMLDRWITKSKTNASSPSFNGSGVTKSQNNPPIKNGGSNTSPSNSRKKWIGIGGAREYNELFPKIEFIRNDFQLRECSADQLEHRAAQYTGSTLYINSMYDALGDFVNELVSDFQTEKQHHLAEITENAQSIAEKEMGWTIVRAVVFAKSKNAKKGFEPEDIETALKPVVLTTHADNILVNKDSFENCKKDLSKIAQNIISGFGEYEKSELDINLEKKLNLKQPESFEFFSNN